MGFVLPSAVGFRSRLEQNRSIYHLKSVLVNLKGSLQSCFAEYEEYKLLQLAAVLDPAKKQPTTPATIKAPSKSHISLVLLLLLKDCKAEVSSYLVESILWNLESNPLDY